MTTQDLYTKVVKGEITEQSFLYEVRRDINLPFITPMNNFKDTVQILKNKGMISEKQTKESTGKQEVEIISKTIDMVNPYEYSRGMDIELGVENEAVGNSEITEDDIKKAQKKVLKNLTKNPSYYSQKRVASMGDSEYEVEVNAKSIADLEKKNKGKKGKIIREHGEEYDRVSDVNADSTPLEEESVSNVEFEKLVNSPEIAKVADAIAKDPKAVANLEKLMQKSGALNEGEGEVDASDIKNIAKALDSLNEEEEVGGGNVIFAGMFGTPILAAITGAIPYVNSILGMDQGAYSNLASGGALMVAGALAAAAYVKLKGLKENIATESVEELGRLRDSIYEKYAKKYGVDIDELKDKVEARKLEMEAIVVPDSETAIDVQKKSPEADVRIVKK